MPSSNWIEGHCYVEIKWLSIWRRNRKGNWRRASLALGFSHVNMLDRYAFTLPEFVARGELRPLRDPKTANPDDEP
jgi:hypothetical protein